MGKSKKKKILILLSTVLIVLLLEVSWRIFLRVLLTRRDISKSSKTGTQIICNDDLL